MFNGYCILIKFYPYGCGKTLLMSVVLFNRKTNECCEIKLN